MKKIIFLVLILFIHNIPSFAQEKIQNARPKEGLEVFYKKFVNELKLPNLPQGVYEVNLRLKFIVERDGSFSNIELIDDVFQIEEEVVKVLQMMPRWIPAVNNEGNVRSAFTLPIKIKVKDDEQRYFANRKEKKGFIESLNTNKIETDYFDLTCNCGIVKSAKNDELKTEEFMLQSQDDQAIYNIAFRKMDAEKAKEELRTIEKDAVDKNAIMEKNMFNGVTATEISLSIPNGDYINNYRTIFLFKNEYIVGISIVSYKKQIADLLFEHLKSNFKLKI